MKKQFNTLLHQILPKHCFLCDEIYSGENLLCCDCEAILPWQPPSCVQCASILPDHADFVLCAACLIKQPPFHATTALFEYQPPISQFILQLKFQKNLNIAYLFSTYWINYIKKYRDQNHLPEILIPVPLHHKRLSERGFNQSLEIAKPIGKKFNIPIDIKSCIRIRDTKAQATLHYQDRINNLKNAFALSHHVNYKHVAIIDDVVTTGSTVTEIAKLLVKTGVENIEIWCCSKT